MLSALISAIVDSGVEVEFDETNSFRFLINCMSLFRLCFIGFRGATYFDGLVDYLLFCIIN